jgi:hypothetical protein
MEDKMRESKNLMAAMLLVVAFLMAAIPAQAVGPARGVRHASPGTAWMVRILDWLGLHPQVLGSIWEADSAHIDPNGNPNGNP